MHLVRGADFHSENLIACGEHPILVDNEALFHQTLPGNEVPKTAREEGLAWLSSSIARQALLPFIYRLSSSGEGVDGSALGGAGGQVARGTVRRWSEAGTDEMRVVEADLVTRESKNRPTLQGKSVDTSAYISVVAGFRETYDLLGAHKDVLRARLEAFAGTTVRYLLRPTRIYTVFLREGRHPNDLRDGLQRDQLLDRLWAFAGLRPALAGAVPYEHQDLLRGDIPFFLCRPESRDLFSSSGERIEDFFPRKSLDESLSMLDSLSDNDRERQVLLIRISLSEAGARAARSATDSSTAASSMAAGSTAERPTAERPTAERNTVDRTTAERPTAVPTRTEPDFECRSTLDDELLAAAVRVGEALNRRAVHGTHGVSWVSIDPLANDRPGESNLRDLAIASSDLYHGGAGVALFLAHLGSVTGDASFTDLARESLRTVREAQAARGAAANRALGPFVGRLSYSYAYQHVAALWSESSWLDLALSDLPQIEEAIDDDGELDVLSGSAGCLVALLRLHEATGEPEPLRLARACGDHLLAKAQPTGAGIAWVGSAFPRAVAGFAHGAAGYARALFELAAATDDARYRQAAEAAIAFERGLLASEEGDDFLTRLLACRGALRSSRHI
ncbi:MAG: type 2 lanthipeptide synthetase LanM [Thermoanaerobaculia bacterium]|nr:type 2 lanthipeptide synthetase LanM [Thermoanaerobaculia bacterium]